MTAVGLGLAGALAACGAKKAPPAPPIPTVAVSHPLVQRIVDWDDYVGRFEAVDQVDVRPRVSGYLQSVGFRDGGYVRKGQVLFVIDPRPYQAALDQAKAQVMRAQATLQNARTELARAEQLFAAHAGSQQDLATRQAAAGQAAADLLAAEAQARSAALNLGFTRVVAPLSGRISDRRVAPGNLVTQDQTVLTTIVTTDPIRFAFTGSEGVYLKYQRANEAGTRRSSRFQANPVEIRLQDEPDYRWKGRMEFVDNALDVNSGTIRGRAVVPNPSGFLTPGMFGHLRLLGSGAYDGLLVPDEAVVTDQTRQVVYVVDGHGKVAQRLVDTGPLVNGLRVIRAGLSAQDVVVVDGVQRARPGITVRTRPGRIEPTSAGQAPSPPGVVTPPAASATIAG